MKPLLHNVSIVSESLVCLCASVFTVLIIVVLISSHPVTKSVAYFMFEIILILFRSMLMEEP